MMSSLLLTLLNTPMVLDKSLSELCYSLSKSRVLGNWQCDVICGCVHIYAKKGANAAAVLYSCVLVQRAELK